MNSKKEYIHEFIYKYIKNLKDNKGSFIHDLHHGLKDINYNMYMYLIGEDITDEIRKEREELFLNIYQTPNFEQHYTYHEPHYIAKIQSSNVMIYLYRTTDDKIRAGNDRQRFNPKLKKFQLTYEEIEKTDKQFLNHLKPVGGFWWQKPIND